MNRLPALLALAIPTLAGLAYMALFGAPDAYPIVNGAALVLAALIVLIGLPEFGERARRIASLLLLVLFALPLVTGPSVNDIARWLPLGPFILHAGMLTIPALAVLAAREPMLGPAALVAAIVVALVQPDFASAFALTGGPVSSSFSAFSPRSRLRCAANCLPPRSWSGCCTMPPTHRQPSLRCLPYRYWHRSC